MTVTVTKKIGKWLNLYSYLLFIGHYLSTRQTFTLLMFSVAETPFLGTGRTPVTKILMALSNCHMAHTAATERLTYTVGLVMVFLVATHQLGMCHLIIADPMIVPDLLYHPSSTTVTRHLMILVRHMVAITGVLVVIMAMDMEWIHTDHFTVALGMGLEDTVPA